MKKRAEKITGNPYDLNSNVKKETVVRRERPGDYLNGYSPYDLSTNYKYRRNRDRK